MMLHKLFSHEHINMHKVNKVFVFISGIMSGILYENGMSLDFIRSSSGTTDNAGKSANTEPPAADGVATNVEEKKHII